MTDKELLARASDYQSFKPGSGKWNEYNGLDDLSMGPVQDDKMYALVHDGQLADLEKGNPTGIEYFFDQATYDKYVDPATGEFDAQGLSQSLQVKPYQSEAMALSDGHAEYRNSIACFDVNGAIRTPVGTCEANTQFGGGGAHEAFIPADESKSLQSTGTLTYNSSASNIHTGQNYRIGADDYNKIQASSDERCLNCENKGLAHPEASACQNGFKPNTPIEGEPFQSNTSGLNANNSLSNNQSGGTSNDPQMQTPGQNPQTGLQSQGNGQNQIPGTQIQQSVQGQQQASQNQGNRQDQIPGTQNQQSVQGQQQASQNQGSKQDQIPNTKPQQSTQGNQSDDQSQQSKPGQQGTAGMPTTSAYSAPQGTSKESVRNQNPANDHAGGGESASQRQQGPDNKSQGNDHPQSQSSSSGMSANAAGSGSETSASSGMPNRAAGQSSGEAKPSSSSQSNNTGMSV